MQFTSASAIEWGPAPDEWFTGKAWFGPMASPDDTEEIVVLGVGFEPGARTHWHSHPGGQVLHCLSGYGLVVNEDGDRHPLTPGDTAQIPAGEVHWHGAGPDSPMFHLSITAGGPTAWTDRPVTDDEYQGA
jgi:quercetin dioxygenase-like cupin family protein